jgi:hypothetical protein
MVTLNNKLLGLLLFVLAAAVPLGCGSSNERPREERSDRGVRVGGDYGVVVDHGVSVGGHDGVVVDHGVRVGGDHGIVVEHPRDGDR